MKISIEQQTTSSTEQNPELKWETPNNEITSIVDPVTQQTAQTQQPAQNPPFVEDNTGLELNLRKN